MSAVTETLKHIRRAFLRKKHQVRAYREESDRDMEIILDNFAATVESAGGIRVNNRVYCSNLKLGQRVAVISSPDAHCDRDIIWGVGEIVDFVFTRVQVHFDNGSGGCFPMSEVYPLLESTCPEKVSWREVSAHLRLNGWELRYQPTPGLPPYHWRSPSGMSGSEFRGDHPAAVPEAVMLQAYKDQVIGFTQLAASGGNS